MSPGGFAPARSPSRSAISERNGPLFCSCTTSPSANSMIRRHIVCFGQLSLQPATNLRSTLSSTKGKSCSCKRCRPFRSEIADREGDLAGPKPPGDIFHQVQVANGVGAVDLDDQPLESRVIGQLTAQTSDRFRFPKEGDGQIDRDLDVTVLADEIAPIIDGAGDHKLRQRFVRCEVLRRGDSAIRTLSMQERFGTAQRERAQVDLRLVP